jgi:hypothetical protein
MFHFWIPFAKFNMLPYLGGRIPGIPLAKRNVLPKDGSLIIETYHTVPRLEHQDWNTGSAVKSLFRRFRTYQITQTMPRSEYTGLKSTLNTVQRWIKRCIKEHPKCQARRGSQPWIPTRLLDLTPAGGRVDICRLVERSEAVAGEAYVTLSHRWESSQVSVLTDQNLPAFRKEICISHTSLSRTFRECIAVVRHLGIRYLWIDSLCIIQSGDGGADWRREAMIMDKVYTNSFLQHIC